MKSCKQSNNILAKREIRVYVKEAILIAKSPQVPDDWQLAFNSSGSITTRLFWITVLVFCSAICSYQIYNRLAHYRMDPISTNIFVEEREYVKMPGLVFCNLDTDALTPYWEKTISGAPSTNILLCSSVARSMARYSVLARKNFTNAWNAINTTSNLEQIFIDYNGNVSRRVKFVNNSVDESANLNDFKWYGKNNIQGLTSVIEITKPVKFGSSINVHVKKQGNCEKQMLTTFISDNFVLFRYMVFGRFKSSIKILPSVVQYNFVHRTGHICEPTEAKAIKCFNNCLKKKLKKLPCRFPFVPEDVKTKDCSLISDEDVIAKTFDDSRAILFYTTAISSSCNCNKPCTQNIFYLHTQKENTDDDTRVLVKYHLGDPYTMVFQEYFVYDTIALLVDVGGNLGLFLGISLLSIVLFMQKGGIYLYGRLKPKQTNIVKLIVSEKSAVTVAGVKQKIEQCIYKFKELSDTKGFSWSKLLHRVVIIMAALLSTYMMTVNIRFYLSEPVRTVVGLEEIKQLALPNIVACGEAGKILIWKKKVAQQMNKPICDVHFLDVLDWTGKKLSLDEIWEARTINIDELKLTAILRISAIDPPRVNFTKIAMHSGECFEFSFQPMSYGGDATGYVLSFSGIPPHGCNDGLGQIYLRPPKTEIHAMLLSQRHFSPNILSRIAIRSFQIKRYNAAARRCVKTKDFERCKNNCYNAKITSSIKCRLPFMKNVNESECSNASMAKESYSTFVQIAIQTDVKKECNCFSPCDENVYQSYVYFDELGNDNSFQYLVPYTNFVENFEENLSYTLVALFCDLGNCFGLTLGISLLTVLRDMSDALSKLNTVIMKKFF